MKFNQRIALSVIILALCIQYGGGAPSIGGDGVYTVIARESAQDDHAFGQLAISLRTGSAGEYFSQGGRRLYIVDDDGTDEKGATIIPPADLEGVNLPAQLAYTKGWKLVGKESLPKGATPQSVIDKARRYGG